MRHFLHRFGVSEALHKVLHQRTVFSDTSKCPWRKAKILSDQNCSIPIGKPRAKIVFAPTCCFKQCPNVMKSGLGEVSRFRDGAHAASYLGLVPTTRQSANSCYHGRITKQGNGHARAMMVQAAQRVGSHPGPLGAFFRRLLKRKNRNVAIVATARKLVGIAWQMLVKNEPYHYAQPTATQTKVARLRLKATGQRQKCGVVPGSSRPVSFGSGLRTKPVPSLPDVLQSAGVPPVRSHSQLPAGELRMLRKTFSLTFVKQIQ